MKIDQLRLDRRIELPENFRPIVTHEMRNKNRLADELTLDSLGLCHARYQQAQFWTIVTVRYGWHGGRWRFEAWKSCFESDEFGRPQQWKYHDRFEIDQKSGRSYATETISGIKECRETSNDCEPLSHGYAFELMFTKKYQEISEKIVRDVITARGGCAATLPNRLMLTIAMRYPSITHIRALKTSTLVDRIPKQIRKKLASATTEREAIAALSALNEEAVLSALLKQREPMVEALNVSLLLKLGCTPEAIKQKLERSKFLCTQELYEDLKTLIQHRLNAYIDTVLVNTNGEDSRFERLLSNCGPTVTRTLLEALEQERNGKRLSQTIRGLSQIENLIGIEQRELLKHENIDQRDAEALHRHADRINTFVANARRIDQEFAANNQLRLKGRYEALFGCRLTGSGIELTVLRTLELPNGGYGRLNPEGNQIQVYANSTIAAQYHPLKSTNSTPLGIINLTQIEDLLCLIGKKLHSIDFETGPIETKTPEYKNP